MPILFVYYAALGAHRVLVPIGQLVFNSGVYIFAGYYMIRSTCQELVEVNPPIGYMTTITCAIALGLGIPFRPITTAVVLGVGGWLYLKATALLMDGGYIVLPEDLPQDQEDAVE